MVRLTQHTIKTPCLVGPIHCYTGVFDGDLVLFDTGPPTTEARKYLQKHINLKSLKHVIVTHCHIDHYGQASWLEENSDATIYLPYKDCLKITEHDRRMSEMYQLLSSLGFDQDYLDGLRRIFDSWSLHPPFPKNFKVAEANLPERLGITVLPCPGHSQSDLVYVGEDWAVTDINATLLFYISKLLQRVGQLWIKRFFTILPARGRSAFTKTGDDDVFA